jgi:putative IMPACT (imprinted ancient) family translation regulator
MTGTLLTDTQLLESYNDDGEKFGGERVLKALREGQGVDVLTVCCRWYGGEMIGVSTL